MSDLRDHKVWRFVQIEPPHLEEKLREKFGHPFSCSYKFKPGGDILWIQDLATKKVFRIRPEEVELAGNPLLRVIDRMNHRIDKGEYDNVIQDKKEGSSDGPSKGLGHFSKLLPRRPSVGLR